MPEFLRPGVFIEEIERGPRPIEGVPTSTAAFLGETERGPLRPTLVTSYNDYRRVYGDPFGSARFMPHAVNGFFENGGKRMYVCRIVPSDATSAAVTVGDFTVRAVGAGVWGNRVAVVFTDSSTKDAGGNPIGFRMVLAYWASVPTSFTAFDPTVAANNNMLPRPTLFEVYDDLTLDPTSADYFKKRLVNATTNRPVSALASLETNIETPAKPATPPAAVPLLSGGADGAAAGPGVNDFTGAPFGSRTELQGISQLELDPFREVSLVYAPRPRDDADDIAKKIITHCENRKFCFAVVDPAAGDGDIGSLEPRNTIGDTSYAAFYFPWILANDPLTGERRLVPPGGHVLGVYARTDTERGVFKAPANEVLRGAIDLEFDVNDGRQDVLNPRGVNAIRRFPGRGIRVFGARTLSSNALWKYVSVRRLFIFLERSIFEGTQFVVFEPNDERLWARVKDTVRLFLRGQFRAGALFGAREEEAFFITCDRTTMTQDDILNGRLICEIGIAPVRPAEFVIFRIFQNTAEAQR